MKAVMLMQLVSVVTVALMIAIALSARVGFGIALILAACISDTLAAWVPVAEIAGTKVYAADGVFGALGLAYFLRVFRRRRWTIVDLLWVFFGICIALSWMRGVSASGLNTATNAMRDFFYFWVGAAYVASFEWKPAQLTLIHRYWVWTSLVLFLIMMSRYFFPIYTIDLSFANEIDLGVDRVFESERDFTALRVLTTDGALFLAQTALLSTIVASRTRKVDVNALLVPLWFASVIVLQHRTVWVATALCLLMLMPRLDLRRPQLIAASAGAALLASALTLWVTMSSRESLLTRSLSGAVLEVSNVNESTFSFRLQLWQNYLDSFLGGSPFEYVFGQPFGTTVYSWIIVGKNIVFTDVFPHSFYIYCLYFTGGFGLLCAVAAYLLAIRGSWSSRPNSDERISGQEWAVFLVGQLVYAVTYGLEVEQSIMIGVGMGLFAAGRRARAGEYGVAVPAYARITQAGGGFAAPVAR